MAGALGAAFGEYLVEQHDFRSVVVNDQYGTDYAVRHQVGSTMAFPVSSVIKRIERNEPDCFKADSDGHPWDSSEKLGTIEVIRSIEARWRFVMDAEKPLRPAEAPKSRSW